MFSKRGSVKFGMAFAITSLMVALSRREEVMSVLSAISFILGYCAYFCRSGHMDRMVCVASLVTLICTLTCVTSLYQMDHLDTLGNIPMWWIVSIGLVHAMPIAPLILVFVNVLTSFTGASINWAIVLVLGPFIGMGMEVPGFIIEYIFTPFDAWLADNTYLLVGMLESGLVALVASVVISKNMKGGTWLITCNGREGLEDKSGN